MRRDLTMRLVSRVGRLALFVIMLTHALANAARLVLSFTLPGALEGEIRPLALGVIGAAALLAFGALSGRILSQRLPRLRVTIGVMTAYQAALWAHSQVFAANSETTERAGFYALWAAGVIVLTAMAAWLAAANKTKI